MSSNSTDPAEFAKKLREANRQGAPQEIQMVFEGGELRPFNEEEDRLIGTSLVASGPEGPSEMPLYGGGAPGWSMKFED